jgi:hypothetical protein
MSTLYHIRDNKKNNENYKLEQSKLYKNPFPVSIISQIIKKQNMSTINEFCKDNNINNYKKEELIKTYIKPNYYTPYIVNSQIKENFQKLNIN